MAARQYKAGMKLKSAVCDTQIMVLRVPAEPLDLRIGGAPALAGDEAGDGATIDPALAGGSLTGKRYTDAEETMEFLCTKGGEGTITVAGREIGIKQAKALPSSD
ncbi:hypothetical protein CV103_13110 [Sphingomonas fennica]|uniref:Uncharacterized protein n=2 Tax=Alphaproteobacteria TaxID=28211 RepID=A0A2T4HU16_9SPHN|nr:hypothetical protein G432_01915 [Sphingomonas sp. MM-1]PTD19299.1 hypothetical protein CV103_13110 [Sphingomonas fennica]